MFTFAHYWGIDEVGVFVIPALIAIFSLRWAERRARRLAAEREQAEERAEEKTEEPSDVE